MTRFAQFALGVLLCIPTAVHATAEYAGSYLLDDGESYVELILQSDTDGTVRGGMNADGYLFRFVAQPVEDKIMGAIIDNETEDQYAILAQLEEDGSGIYVRIFWEVDALGNADSESAETFFFNRVGTAVGQQQNPYAAPQQTSPSATQQNNPYAPPQQNSSTNAQQSNPYAPPQQNSSAAAQQNNPYAPPSQNSTSGTQQNNPYAPQSQSSASGTQQNNPYAPPQQQQTNPYSNPGSSGSGSGAESQVINLVSGRHVLIAWREGGALYGTYRYYDIHHCRSGTYLEYGYSSKNSVTGSTLTNNWQSTGSWQVTTQQGRSGVYYVPNGGNPEFVPMQVYPDGSVFVNEGVSFSVEGAAQCQ